MVDRSIWGPAFWRLIHSAARAYTPERSLSFRQFIASLPGVLPCGECREHIAVNLRRVLPLRDSNLLNDETLFLWTFNLHDIVNKQLGKRSPPFADVKKLYYSGDGRNPPDPNFWGPSAWTVIHSIARTFSPDRAVYFKSFVYSLPGVLPCSVCREHLAQNLINVVPLKQCYLRSDDNAFLWTYRLHQAVNEQLGKKRAPSFAEVWKVYYQDRPCKLCTTS